MDAVDRKQIGGSLKRFGDEIISVDRFFKDTNGPKGSIDKQAVLPIRLRGGKQLALLALRADWFAAISVAAKRARRAVRRHLRKAFRVEKVSLRSLVAEPHFHGVSPS